MKSQKKKKKKKGQRGKVKRNKKRGVGGGGGGGSIGGRLLVILLDKCPYFQTPSIDRALTDLEEAGIACLLHCPPRATGQSVHVVE